LNRPSFDVVVPFFGSGEALASLRAELARLVLRPGDTVTVVDNRPATTPEPTGPGPGPGAGPRIVAAPERQSSYFARNRGAAAGSAEWLLFIDADVEAPPDLLDRYLDRAAAQDAGALVGEVVDAELDDDSRVGRYLTESSSMSQANTMHGEWPYGQTANCAVRRTAFEQVGGFRDDIRSGGDADLCFRLRAAGWRLEQREEAVVRHRARTTVRALVRQRARHGAGCAWLDREYPGSFPAAPLRRLSKQALLDLGSAAGRLSRGDREGAVRALLDSISAWAFRLGRLYPNRTSETA
jgi:glycosyltransferase involved in cell wall biosynthesis